MDADGKISNKGTFLAGLGAGATEAVAVVTPMEVIKIRLQAQQRELGCGRADFRFSRRPAGRTAV